MRDSNLKLYLISDLETSYPTENLFGQIGSYNIEIISSNEIVFEPKNPAVYIIQLFEKQSELVDKILNTKNIRKDRFVFIISELSVSSITKLIRKGFSRIFLLPDEIEELKIYLLKELKGLDINFRSKYKSLTENEYFLKSTIGSGENSDHQINLLREYAADSRINLIIQGETGSGKMSLARVVHKLSSNGKNSLSELIYPFDISGKFSLKIETQSETFYIDVENDYDLFNTIPPGTLIIRNVDDMPRQIQKRFINNFRENYSHSYHNSKFRTISTTTESLEGKVMKGEFDEELFYFLNTTSFEITPIRFRKDDIQNLFEHFVIEFSQNSEKKITKIDSEVFDFIFTYPWPGNIQELKNTVQNAVIFSEESTLKLLNFSNLVNIDQTKQPGKTRIELESYEIIKLEFNYQNFSLEEVSRFYTEQVFKKLKNNKSKAAEILGVSRPTLTKLLSKD